MNRRSYVWGTAACVALLACGDDKNSGGVADAVDGAGDDATADATVDATADATDDATAPEDTTAPADTTPASEASVVVLLDTTTQMAIGLSPPLFVDVPEGVVSITISVIGDDATYYGLSDWTGGDGFELVKAGWANTDEGQGGICLSCNNRIAVSGAAFASIAPNNPASHVSAGHHTFSLFGYKPPPVVQGNGQCGDNICNYIDQFQCPQDCRASFASGPTHVLVHAKLDPHGLPATGVLDLNLHFTGAQGLTADSAKTDASFQSMLDSMRTIYGQVGITLGMITYRDIDSVYRSIESIDGAGSDLQSMFAESAGNADALNLFFVDEIATEQFGGIGVILGIAGGIPGPIAQGSWRSGVAIAIKPVPGAPAGIDTTMAHESGHFLGLFHSSEQAFFGPAVHDPLPDTPENDATNLMFNTGAGHILTTQQGDVMRASVWVRHPAAAAAVGAGGN